MQALQQGGAEPRLGDGGTLAGAFRRRVWRGRPGQGAGERPGCQEGSDDGEREWPQSEPQQPMGEPNMAAHVHRISDVRSDRGAQKALVCPQ